MEGIPCSGLRVLIVEDCPDTAATLAQLVRLWGHATCIASNGAQALKQSLEFQPDIILLDIGLPGMNGWEVAKRLRELPSSSETLLIAITGFGQEDDRRHSEDAGCHLHLTKPVEPSLLRTLLDLLRKKVENCTPDQVRASGEDLSPTRPSI